MTRTRIVIGTESEYCCDGGRLSATICSMCLKGAVKGTRCRNRRDEEVLQKTDGLSDLHVRPPTAFR